MDATFIEQHLMTNLEIAELLRQWERKELRPARVKPSKRIDYSVTWGEPSSDNPATNTDRTLSIDESRAVLYDAMKAYYDSPELGALLIKAQAGIGKSTTAIKFAQDMARLGARVLYLMPRHNYYKDIESSPFFEPGMWYHWRPTTGKTDDGDPMCAKNRVASTWMAKGYPLISVCKALCLDNKHMEKCPYRKQAQVPYPIIAGVHNHATTGLGITNFDLVIVDELPVGGFLTERVISPRKIDSIGTGSVGKLLSKLRDISVTCNNGEKISERKLLEHIAPLLREVVEQIKQNADELEWKNRPPIYGEEDIDKAKEWFLVDLVYLLIPELIAYEQGLDTWLSRVYVDSNGLHLMLKAAPWESLPPRIIVLDATGRTDIYEHLFNIKFTAVEPRTRMVGKLYQIANSMYGIGSVLKDEKDKDGNRKLTWRGRELLALCQFIAEYKGYKRIGIVSYKGMRYAFEAVFGEDNVLHFLGSRGTNSFMLGETPVDAIIIAGTPAPPDPDIQQMAAQIYFDPMAPERSKISLHEGTLGDARSSVKVEYPYLNEDGLAPYRFVGGFWEYDVLQTVMALHREDEIRQSLHRARPLIHDADVWLLTTVPTTEPLTGFYENPDQIDAHVASIGWKNWLRIHQTVSRLDKGVYSAADLTHLIGTKNQYTKSWMPVYAATTNGKVEWNGSELTII